MKKIKNIILGLGVFLIIAFFLAVFTATSLSHFYESAFIFDNSFLIESTIFGMGTFLTGLYLIFFDFSEKSLKDSVKKANYKFKRFWKSLCLEPYQFIKNNKVLSLKIFIVIVAIFLSFKYISFTYSIMGDEDGQWVWIVEDSLSRSLFGIHMFWALLRILIVWMVSFGLLSLLNDKKFK
jgi:hypothetical protein